MIVWENDSDTIVLKPIEIRGKRGVKKMKKTSSAIYIPNMDAKEFDKICAEKGLQFIYTPVPPHGDLIDRDALLDTATIHWSQTTNESCFLIDEIEYAPIIIPAEPPKEGI